MMFRDAPGTSLTPSRPLRPCARLLLVPQADIWKKSFLMIFSMTFSPRPVDWLRQLIGGRSSTSAHSRAILKGFNFLNLSAAARWHTRSHEPGIRARMSLP